MAEWSPEQILGKLNGNKAVSAPDTVRVYHYEEGEHIPLSAWEDAMFKAAKLVNELGEEYIALFERAEREYEAAKQNLSAIERMKMLSEEKPHSQNNQIL